LIFDNTFALALEKGAGFDRQVFVPDIANHMCRFGEVHVPRLNLAIDRAVNKNRLGDDFTCDRGGFADQQGFGTNIAVNCTIDLYLAIRVELAYHLEIGANDRRG